MQQPHLNRSLIASAFYALAVSGRYFGELLPVRPRHDLLLHGKYLLVTAVLYLSVIGLVSRIPLFIAALVGLWMFSFFFSYVYGGGYRHHGILVVFLITLYWIALRREPTLDIDKRLKQGVYYFPYRLITESGLKRTQADTGAVTLRKPIASAANLNIHLHWRVADGLTRG